MGNHQNKKRIILGVLGVFALVVVTTGASFAFFQYSRTGNTKVNVTSGDITFSYMEDNEDAKLVNAFPVADSVGAVDVTGQYEFTVSLTSSNAATSTNYNVILLDNNKGEDNYFTNDQIKFALVKNNVYVAGTSASSGQKLSSIAGFTSTATTGEGTILEDQEITAGQTDTYKLRIWISDDVSYNNDIENGEEVGKYNGYTYSLKVKVTSNSDNNTIAINDLKVERRTMTATIVDPNGLVAYAVTNSKTTPTSEEWIAITSEAAMNNESKVIRTATMNITSKTITFDVTSNGTYYLHVKNAFDQIKTKSFVVNAETVQATKYIMDLSATETDEIRIVEHEATGQQNFSATDYRYYGANPNNYVTFNNELWRIIGVFDVDDGNGNIEKRLKIIRSEPIGKYSWDSSAPSINEGYGVNEWSQSDIKTLLNDIYYNSKSGTCYNGRNNATVACDFTSSGLTSKAKLMISDTKWYHGSYTAVNVTSDVFYNKERGTTIGKTCSSGSNCNDGISRTTSWIGNIGLMYPSDYGYAAGSTCDATSLNNYSASCKDLDWLYNSTTYQWTMSPYAFPAYASVTFCVTATGFVSDPCRAYAASAISPVTYLKASVEITSGTGSSSKPYELSL